VVLGSKIKQAADTLDHGSFKVYPWVAFYYSNQEYGGSGDLDDTPVYRRWEYRLRARYGLADGQCSISSPGLNTS
jgi:hypothetical protein